MARVWKQIGLIILIIACLFNIISKITAKVPLATELQTSSEYLRPVEDVTK